MGNTTEEIIRRIENRLEKAGYKSGDTSILKFDITDEEPKNDEDSLDWFPSDRKQMIEVISYFKKERGIVLITEDVDSMIEWKKFRLPCCLWLVPLLLAQQGDS